MLMLTPFLVIPAQAGIQLCSPDGAKRNPGADAPHEESRELLRAARRSDDMAVKSNIESRLVCVIAQVFSRSAITTAPEPQGNSKSKYPERGSYTYGVAHIADEMCLPSLKPLRPRVHFIESKPDNADKEKPMQSLLRCKRARRLNHCWLSYLRPLFPQRAGAP